MLPTNRPWKIIKQAVERRRSVKSASYPRPCCSFANALLIRCLDKVATFMMPILQGLKDMTGYTWVLLGGGPNPRAGGEVGTVQ